LSLPGVEIAEIEGEIYWDPTDGGNYGGFINIELSDITDRD